MQPIQMLSEIDIQRIKNYLSKQPDVILAYLFGSVARGKADSLSDIVFAVLLEDGLSPETYLERQLQILIDLDQLTKQNAQVILLNRASPMLAYQVIRDGGLLFERSREEKANFEVIALKRYFDIKPMLAYFNQALNRRIKEEGLGRRKRRSASALEAARRVHERLTGISRS